MSERLKALDYATPPAPEPLGRWLLRRLIMFPLVIAALYGVLALVARAIFYLGWLDFLSQN